MAWGPAGGRGRAELQAANLEATENRGGHDSRPHHNLGAQRQPVQQRSRKVSKFEQSWPAHIFDHRDMGRSS